jgi:hypothetical protein
MYRCGCKSFDTASPNICLWLLAMSMLLSACGYRIRSAVGSLPHEIQSIGIPTFENLTSQYKIEQMISSAVLKEFSLRTTIPVNSSESGVDSVLLGEIREVSSTPVTFGLETFGNAFLVTVRMSARLKRLRDSSIIWQNEEYIYHERYILNSKVRDFFSEENPALNRLAKDFAASLVSTILNR